jgi:tetratricopeptide (TPR) repeat protein
VSRILGLRRKKGLEPDLVKAQRLIVKGRSLAERGAANKALANFQDALAICSRARAALTAVGKMSLGGGGIGDSNVVELYVGHYQKRPAELRTHLESACIGELEVLAALPRVYGALGRPHEAFEAARKAVDVSLELRDHGHECVALNNLGFLCEQHLGRPEDAIEYYGRALDIARRHGHRESEGHALHGLARTYLALQRPEEAGRYLREVAELGRQPGR